MSLPRHSLLEPFDWNGLPLRNRIVMAPLTRAVRPVDTKMNPAEGDFTAMLKKLMALPRYGTVDEIAGMVAYLASPEAGYITSASLLIDGGSQREQCAERFVASATAKTDDCQRPCTDFDSAVS
jgi:Enoyl-(Acyl carrier protein) reductase